MILSLVLAFAFMGSTARADVTDRVNDLNQRVKAAGTLTGECETCGVSLAGLDQGKNAVQQCVESLCPDPNLSLSALLEEASQRAFSYGTDFDKEFMPLINEIEENQAKNNLKEGEDYLDWLKTAPPLTDKAALRIYNLIDSMKDISKFTATVKDGKYVADEQASRAQFPKLSQEEYSKKVRIYNEILPIFLDKPFFETDPVRLKIMYSDKELSEKIEKAIQETEKRIQTMSKDPELKILANLPEFKELASTDKIRKPFKEGRIDSAAMDDLNSNYLVVHLFSLLSTDQNFKNLLNREPVDIKKVASERGIEAFVKRQILEARNVLDHRRYDVGSSCRAAAARAEVMFPSESELTDFKSYSQQLKSRFLDRAQNYLSSESAAKMREEARGWTPIPPTTKEAFMKSMKSALQKELTESRQLEARRKEQLASADRSQCNSILAASLNSEREDPLVTQKVCESMMPNPIPDASSPGNGGFIVGPLVVKNKKALADITYHELGHLLSGLMRSGKISQKTKGWYDQSNKCLESNHTEGPSDVSQYDEEDWADLISSAVGEKDQNFSCLLTRQQWPIGYEVMSLKNPDESDVHSSWFFRLLHIQFLKKGGIPAVCRQALAAQGQKASFKNCLGQGAR